MPKRRKISPEKILDYLGTINASTRTRLVALAIFHSINGTDPSLELLAFRTGIHDEKSIETAISVLREVGVLSYVEGRMHLQVPDFSTPQIDQKFDPQNVRSTADEVSELLTHYKILWIKRYKRQFSTNGRDRARLADLVEQIGSVETKSRLDNYLKCDDVFLTDRGHPLSIFAKTSNGYCRGTHAKAQIVKRSDDFDEEVRRFETERFGKNDC